MKDNHRGYEEKRQTSRNERVENKRVVLEGKQRTIFKEGKKFIIPSKLIIQDINEPIPNLCLDGTGNAVEGKPVKEHMISSAMDEEKPSSHFGLQAQSSNTMNIEK